VIYCEVKGVMAELTISDCLAAFKIVIGSLMSLGLDLIDRRIF
jgi:hypothetical protein